MQQRALELDVATGERMPGGSASTALEQLLTRQYGLHRLRSHHSSTGRRRRKAAVPRCCMGKEIKGKPVSMTELNVKMGTAIVEGKVFAAECRETKRARYVDV